MINTNNDKASNNYTLLDSGANQKKILLPNNFNEIIATIALNGSTGNIYIFNFTKSMLTNSVVKYANGKGINVGGYYHLEEVYLDACLSYIQLYGAKHSANSSIEDFSNTSILTVYYR